MGDINDFRDLVAWRRAMDLAVMVNGICRALPRHEWELKSQMRRAANSVHSNIAEGNGRSSTADYLRCLYLSRSELNDLESDLLYVQRCYNSTIATEQALELTVNTRRPLAGLIKALEKKKGNE
jgi:four helix bundle protein